MLRTSIRDLYTVRISFMCMFMCNHVQFILSIIFNMMGFGEKFKIMVSCKALRYSGLFLKIIQKRWLRLSTRIAMVHVHTSTNVLMFDIHVPELLSKLYHAINLVKLSKTDNTEICDRSYNVFLDHAVI